MNQLVFVLEGEPVAKSDAIAEATDNEHRAILQLVRKYLSDFEEFGRVAFEMQPFDTAGGTQQRQIAMLNEQQATLLLTYLRNNEIVRSVKKRLVREFYEMANHIRRPSQPAIPQTYAEALQLAADQARQIEQQQAQIEAQQPAVEFTERVTESSADLSIDATAKVLQAPIRKFRAWMKAIGVFRKDDQRLPLQRWIDRGYFRVAIVEVPIGRSKIPYPQTFVTGKGLAWLQIQLDRHPMTASKALQAIN